MKPEVTPTGDSASSRVWESRLSEPTNQAGEKINMQNKNN
jgi:hypothetical protein